MPGRGGSARLEPSAHNQKSSAEQGYTHHDKRRRNPHWNQISQGLTQQSCQKHDPLHRATVRPGQGDVASLDDEIYEILLPDQALRAQCETGIAPDKWLATEPRTWNK